jgi:hypothetical protein
MTTSHLNGRITVDGKLKVQPPVGLPAQSVSVAIQVGLEEITALLISTPKIGAEIAERIRREGSGWEDMGISDGAEWVREQRQFGRTF